MTQKITIKVRRSCSAGVRGVVDALAKGINQIHDDDETISHFIFISIKRLYRLLFESRFGCQWADFYDCKDKRHIVDFDLCSDCNNIHRLYYFFWIYFDFLITGYRDAVHVHEDQWRDWSMQWNVRFVVSLFFVYDRGFSLLCLPELNWLYIYCMQTTETLFTSPKRSLTTTDSTVLNLNNSFDWLTYCSRRVQTNYRQQRWCTIHRQRQTIIM